MQLNQKQLHQKKQATEQQTSARSAGPCISFCSCLWRALGKPVHRAACASAKNPYGICIALGSIRNRIWQARSFSTGVYVCVCFETFFCWEHNCAFWFWRLLAKEPRSIVISNGPMESDTQSWLVHSEHPCINFPSGQQCVWCGHHPMFFAECLRHQCWRWRVVQDRIWLGHGQVNHFNNGVENILCVGIWVWKCDMFQ